MSNPKISFCELHEMDKQRKDCGRFKCVKCVSEKSKKYYEQNKEKILQKQKIYVENNKQSISEYSKRYDKEVRHPDYGIWKSMKSRCCNPKNPMYKHYGGRNISICDRWLHSFDSFIEDMGPRPEPKSDYSLERKDNNGNYEFKNCRWATAEEQANNTSKNIKYRMNLDEQTLVLWNNETITIKQLSEITGIHLIAIKYRWAQHSHNVNWIIDDKGSDNRIHIWKEQRYSLVELSHISGIPYSRLHGRLLKSNWSTDKAMRSVTELIKSEKKGNSEKQVSSAKTSHPDYDVWVGILRRCYNPKFKYYYLYGGRGISVCDRWRKSFWNFIEDVGSRPEPRSYYSIERIDTNGNYEPSNCKWETADIQAQNTRRSAKYRKIIPDDSTIFYQNKTMSILEFSKLTGIHLDVVRFRYAQHPNVPEWIISTEWDVRYFTWRGHNYNVAELALISGNKYPKMYQRLVVRKWDVDRAMKELD
jgi:hypothetical protein